MIMVLIIIIIMNEWRLESAIKMLVRGFSKTVLLSTEKSWLHVTISIGLQALATFQRHHAAWPGIWYRCAEGAAVCGQAIERSVGQHITVVCIHVDTHGLLTSKRLNALVQKCQPRFAATCVLLDRSSSHRLVDALIA